MKFTYVVVMLAFAVGVQSTLYAGHYAPAVAYSSSVLHTGWPYAAVHVPASVAIHSATPWGYAVDAWDHNGAWTHNGYPGLSLSQGPSHEAARITITHGDIHSPEGVYVAQTRGAIHKAPLTGHINSATSINLAPAPGTH